MPRSDSHAKDPRVQVWTELTHVEFIGGTSDTWTSAAHQGFNCVCVHGLTDDFHMVSRVLCVQHLPGASMAARVRQRRSAGSHTGLALATDQVKQLREFGVEGKLVCLTTDAASNARRSREDTEAALGRPLEELNCVAHQLNLSVQKALEHLDDILAKVRVRVGQARQCRTQVRRVVAWLHRSTLQSDKLKELQEAFHEEERLLPGDCPTRCDQTCRMV